MDCLWESILSQVPSEAQLYNVDEVGKCLPWWNLTSRGKRDIKYIKPHKTIIYKCFNVCRKIIRYHK